MQDRNITTLLLAFAALAGCAGAPAPERNDAAQEGPQTAGSILASSSPAAGSTVPAPVDELVLHFSPPARLLEVTANGPDSTMPIMVTAAGEQRRYSIPLSGLGPGSYTVSWRASAAGTEHRGTIPFTVR